MFGFHKKERKKSYTETYSDYRDDEGDYETDIPQRRTDNALFFRAINSRVESIVRSAGNRYLYESGKGGKITKCIFKVTFINEASRKIHVTADVVYKIDMYNYKDYDYDHARDWAQSDAETDMEEFSERMEDDLNDSLQDVIGRLQNEYDNYDGDWELDFRLNSNITT